MIDTYSSIENYMNKINASSVGLGADREKELSRIIKHSNSQASRDRAVGELVNGNLGLVIRCAKELLKQGQGLTLMDLIVEGNFWLFYSARHFNYKKKCRFSTYAYPIIRWHILYFIYSSNNIIHIPHTIVDQRKKFENLKLKYGKELNKEILMKELGIFRDAADNLKNAFNLKVESLDAYLGTDKDGSLKDIIKDNNAPDPSVNVDKKTLKAHIAKICDRYLTANEKKVITLMYLGEDYIDSKELATQLNVSYQRILQVRNIAFKKLQQGFMNNWDIKHKEDRIDKEQVYREITGFNGYLSNYHMRVSHDPEFIKKMKEKRDSKSKKIFKNLLGK